MAFPAIEAIEFGNDTTPSNVFTIPLPAGQVSGELLLVCITQDGSGLEATAPTFDVGWTFAKYIYVQQAVTFACYWIESNGAIPNPTYTLPEGTSEVITSVAFRISNWGPITLGRVLYGSGATILDLPELYRGNVPNEDQLLICVYGQDNGGIEVTGFPVDFPDNQSQIGGTSGGTTTAICSVNQNGKGISPFGQWTKSIEQAGSYIIGITPPATGGAGNVIVVDDQQRY